MEKKQLRCPFCGLRLIDAVSNNKLELMAEENMKAGWKPDYFQE